MSVYDEKPARFFKLVVPEEPTIEDDSVFCAGFENGEWRCNGMAIHLVEWLPDFALSDDLLSTITHTNAYDRLRKAAERIYSSEKYEKRGEVGEITAHAICREFFDTVPIAPRVHYKSTSNEVIKGFDLVHARVLGDEVEVWFGEAKTYTDSAIAVAEAIKSVREHLEGGFLKSQKLLLGPQIPQSTPKRDKLVSLFEANTPLDDLVSAAIFPIVILADSDAIKNASVAWEDYPEQVAYELQALSNTIEKTELKASISVPIIYVPLESKKALLEAFDKRLKGLQ